MTNKKGHVNCKKKKVQLQAEIINMMTDCSFIINQKKGVENYTK